MIRASLTFMGSVVIRPCASSNARMRDTLPRARLRGAAVAVGDEAKQRQRHRGFVLAPARFPFRIAIKQRAMVRRAAAQAVCVQRRRPTARVFSDPIKD